MKLFTGSLAAGLVLLAGGAQAQVPGPYRAASDFDAPMRGAVPGSRAAVRTRSALCTRAAATDTALALACCRRRKSTPCCATTDSRRSASRRLRGFVYTIAVIDRGGEDGRLIIDARNGRIIRFMPAYRMGGDNYYEEPEHPRRTLRGAAAAGPSAGPCPGRAAAVTAGPCCEPRGADAEGQPDRRQACAGTGPAGGRACPEAGRGVRQPPPVTTGSAPAKPAPQIAPTQDMPTAQGLE